MIQKLINLLKIFDQKDQFKLILLFFMTIFAMSLEVISIVAVLPVIREFLSSDQKFNFLNEINFFQEYDIIYIAIIFLIFVHLVKFLYLFFFYYVRNSFINNLSAKLTSRLYSNYLFKNFEFHTRKKTSIMVRNLITETKLLCSTFIAPVFEFIIETTIILGIVIFLFIYDKEISLIVGIGFAVLIAIYSIAVKKKFLMWGKARQDLNNNSLKLCLDGLAGIKDIMIYYKENFFREKFSKNEFEFARVSKLNQTFQQLPRLVFEFIIIFFLILLVFFLKIKEMPNNEIMEIVAVFGIASVRFIPSASRILGSFQQIRYGIPALNIILNEQISSSKYYDDLSKNRRKNINYQFKNSIKFKNINYNYTGKENGIIFENLNLEINKNQIIGIYGPSGSGKSTFADLLSGLLTPTSGKILLDDENVTQNPYALRAIFAYVPQLVYLLNDTIKNNITFGENLKNVDINKLQKSIKLSQLSSLVETAPDGVETIVGERGSMLSGGQIQRIGIARAIYHESEVLIFDESTNALDSEAEQKIIEEIADLKKTKTIIIISHKISNLQICDKVFQLKDKKLIQVKN
jgi:ABC-type multidrug transport system fused ATPase/permease subunit